MSNPWTRVDRGVGAQGELFRHDSDPKRWLVRVFIGRDAKGKKKTRSKVVRGTKRDALAVLTDMLQAKYHGRLTPRTSATVADLIDEWLAHKVREVTPRTLDNYRQNLTNYVLPTLGHRRLADITLRDVDALYGAMIAGNMPEPEGAKRWTGRGLSPRTVRLTHAPLSQALSQAVKWGMIPFNPAAEATLPSGKPKEKAALSVAERQRFITASAGAFHRIFYLLLMDTGLRPGEACALRWTDLDFDRERIHVERAATTGENRERITDHPKTSKSRRTLPMFTLRDELLAHRAWQAEYGLDVSGYVFTTQDGRPLAPWTFGKGELRRVLKVAGYTGTFSLYSFRHTFATLHLQSGTPLKVVSDWLGHSTIQQTANTYQHLSADVSDDWARHHVAFLEAASATREEAVN